MKSYGIYHTCSTLHLSPGHISPTRYSIFYWTNKSWCFTMFYIYFDNFRMIYNYYILLLLISSFFMFFHALSTSLVLKQNPVKPGVSTNWVSAHLGIKLRRLSGVFFWHEQHSLKRPIKWSTSCPYIMNIYKTLVMLNHVEHCWRPRREET